jgi:CitMHS family citrate-Mg2+:H+ or citrate-Ca2+:H+ symporter
METVVGFIMLAIIVFLLVSNKTSIIPVFGILPILAAMALGYGIKDIQKFMNDGFGSVLNTVVLFAFAVMYFSILSEVGMFDVIVNKVMRYLGNSVLAVLYVASFVTIISHLDGSGATTALVTIPTMLPIFKKMKMRPICVVFVMSIMSGAMNITPWCASMLRVYFGNGTGCAGTLEISGSHSGLRNHHGPSVYDPHCGTGKEKRSRNVGCRVCGTQGVHFQTC